MLSLTEENYLKTIYSLAQEHEAAVSTNGISDYLDTRPASVSDMLKKLAQKELIHYIKYKGVTLTDAGNREALKIIRKHRLWEVFLVEKMKFNWDEVHEVAEQLEHIKSPLLIKRLDEFLSFPRFDPHGDPIPTDDGELIIRETVMLQDLEHNKSAEVVGVKDTSAVFLKYLDKLGVSLGCKIEIVDSIEFDQSLEIEIDSNLKRLISKEVAQNIFVEE